MQSTSESATKGNKLADESYKEFYKFTASIPTSMKFEEKTLNYNIQVDSTMAHVGHLVNFI